MATKKKTTKKAERSRLLTATERKALMDRFYSYINLIDSLGEKNINVQIKSDLKKFKTELKKSLVYLRRF